MSKRVNRVQYTLDSKGIKALSNEDIKMILRGADDLIMTGGRNMLAKILKGSKDKKLLELKLNESPVYGYYQSLKIADIIARIDWCIENDFLAIEYDYRLPFLKYTKKGWEIEKDTYSDELLQKINRMCFNKDYSSLIQFKETNRQIILMLLDKIENTENNQYIPVLEEWKQIDYKKVQGRISSVIKRLKMNPQ